MGNVTQGCVKANKVEYVLEKLNSLHKDTQFTYELEQENNLSYLDVFLVRNDNNN